MPQGYNLTPINSDIYSAGNVLFDSRPYVAYALETKARNQAKDDAFARAFQDLGSRITPAGMDGADIDNFMKRKKEWQDYVVKNEAAYKNPALDNGQVYGEAMRRYNNVLGVIQISKDKLDALKPLQQIYADPNKRNLITEQTMMDAHRGTLPINHPDYKRFDVNSINFNPEPFSQTKANSYLDQVRQNVTGEKVYGKERIDPATKSKYSPYTIKINPNDYQIIRNYAANLSGSDASAARFFDQELNNPEDYAKNNAIYKQYFGQDKNIQTREDMATAWTLGLLDLESKGEEKSTYSPTIINASGLGDNSLINNIFDKTRQRLEGAKLNGVNMLPINSIDSDAANAILDGINSKRSEKNKITPEDVRLILGNDGSIRAVDMLSDGDVVAIFTPESLNSLVNKTQKEKQVMRSNESTINVAPTSKFKPNKKFKGIPEGGF